MPNRFLLRGRLLAVLTLFAVAGVFPAARGWAASNYTITKLVDGNAALPDEPGQTFASFENTLNQFVLDGDTVAFTVQTPNSTVAGYSIWTISASGGTPVRLADTTKAVPGQTGLLFNNLRVCGIGGGMVVFVGAFNGGIGLYAIPSGGGAITKLVDTSTPMPGSTVDFGFQQNLESVAVHGAQALFAADDGYYFVPVTGGAITRFGDGTTPVVDPSGSKYFPNDFAGVGGSQEADFGGGTVSFLPTYGSGGFTELFTGPASGLTDGANGVANNDAFVAGVNTPVPNTSGQAFDPQTFDAFVDDSGAVVFYNEASDGGDSYFVGLYTTINGVITALADNHTVVAGKTNPITSIYGEIHTTAVSAGQVYFYASTVTAGQRDPYQGVYTVPVLGGAVTPVATTDDVMPGTTTNFTSAVPSFGGVSGGRVVFYGGAFAEDTFDGTFGMFLATPKGGTVSTVKPLLLSTHTGGNTGPVTVTATIVPGTAALVSGATVKLAATGQPDIDGGSVTVNSAGIALTTVFDLTGQATGTYDFVITNPDGSTVTLPATFTVEAGTGPITYADLIGRFYLRGGYAQTYTLVVGNRGDVDAAAVPVFVNFPPYLAFQLASPLLTPPQPAGLSEPLDFSQVPLTHSNGDHTVLPLIIPKVPAGGLVTVQLLFTAPDAPQYAHMLFDFGVGLGESLVDAETGLAAAPGSGSALAKGGEHIESVGLTSTCLAGLFNLFVDCGSTFIPFLKTAKCGPAALLYLENTAAGLGSDNANATDAALSQGQVCAGEVGLLLTCVGAFPGLGTVINIVQCGVDLYLLYDNCIKPIIPIAHEIIVSGDPNDLSGSVGDGSPAHYLTGAQPLRYGVYFENESTASAAAQKVVITNPLDANLDLSTFSLGPIGFGSTLLNPPAGAQNYAAVVDLRPANNLLVQVTATLNIASRTLSYTFQSLDPATNQPPTDPTAGFLPPDSNPPAGDGFALYYANPTAGLPTGTVINDQANIVFDANAAIATPTWTNTLDNDAPASQVAALPVKEKTSLIPLQVTGHDNGSGVSFYNIFVSEDGGAFQPLVKNAAGPTVNYNGVTGHSYTFFSQAIDGAGNVEPLKTAAEATTKVRGADLIGVWKGDVTMKTTASGLTKLAGEFKVTNQSPQRATAADSVVRFYLSADATLDSSDPVIGKDAPFDVLAPGASVKLAVKGLKLPAGVSVSGMYVLAVINPDSNIPETDRTNNTVAYGPFP